MGDTDFPLSDEQYILLTIISVLFSLLKHDKVQTFLSFEYVSWNEFRRKIEKLNGMFLLLF